LIYLYPRNDALSLFLLLGEATREVHAQQRQYD